MVTTTTGLATSFITFTRTSNATVTDSNGFIEWAGHNLLTNSESFDASSWSRQGLSGVTANAIAAPNGTTTADKLLENNLNDFHYAAQLNVIDDSAPVSTLSVFAKAAERQYLNLALAWGANFVAATFDLTGGTVTSNRSGGTGASQSSSIMSVGGGWYLCTLRGTIGTGGSDAAIIAISDSATPTGAYPQYTGTTGNGFHVWGAHLYRSDLGGMVLNPARGDAYYPTTPRNLLGFTEDANSWTKNAATVTTNSAIAPNGLQTADLIVNTTDNSAHGVYQSISFSTACTMSVYAKAGASNFVGLTNTSSTTPAAYSGAVFNLTAGTVTLSNNCTATITAVGDGWYRCAITALTVAGSFFIVYVGQNGTSAPWTSYTGSGQSIYLWGAQLSDSASLDAYSPVYGAAVTSAAYYAPRLDFDPVTLAARGLLVEEQRTNVLLHTAAFDNASWDKVAVGTASAPVVTANNATAPDGTLTADLVVFDRGAGTSGDRSVLSQAPSLSAGTYTQSVWLKAATAGDIGKQLALRNVAGGTYLVVTLTASWVRYERTEVWAANNWEITNRQGITADTTVSAHVWGAQLELGSFATSYIPTGASTATRTADVASVSTQAFPYSSTAGSYVANFQTLFSGANSLTTTILTVDGSGSKLIAYIAGGAQNPGTFDGSTIISVANDVTGSVAKIGSSFDASGRSFCANGSTVATGTVAAGYGSGSAVNIGGTLGTGYINGWFRQLTYIPRRLSSSELQARTL